MSDNNDTTGAPLIAPDGTHQGYVRGDGMVALFQSPAEAALRTALREAKAELEAVRRALPDYMQYTGVSLASQVSTLAHNERLWERSAKEEWKKAEKLEQSIAELEQSIAELEGLLRELVELGPPSDDNHSANDCCGKPWSEPHASNCPWLLAKKTLEQARPPEPTTEPDKESEEDSVQYVTLKVRMTKGGATEEAK